MLTLIRELTRAHPDHAIAAQLNARGLRTRQDKPWTYARVASMRRQHGIATACPIDTRATTARADGLVSLRAAAERLGLAQATIRIWAHRGVVSCDQRCAASKLWVRLTDADVARLDGSATPSGLTGIADVMRQDQITREEVWDRVRAGRYIAYRVRHGLEGWQWGLRPTTSASQPLHAAGLRTAAEGAALWIGIGERGPDLGDPGKSDQHGEAERPRPADLPGGCA